MMSSLVSRWSCLTHCMTSSGRHTHHSTGKPKAFSHPMPFLLLLYQFTQFSQPHLSATVQRQCFSCLATVCECQTKQTQRQITDPLEN